MSETEKSATEILANNPKAYLMLLTGLKVAQERLEGAADWEAKEARAKQGEALALERTAATEAEAEKIMRDATAKAEQIVGMAQKDEATIRGRIAGARQELADLEGKVAEATATIRQGKEWQQKMDEAAAIARQGRV